MSSFSPSSDSAKKPSNMRSAIETIRWPPNPYPTLIDRNRIPEPINCLILADSAITVLSEVFPDNKALTFVAAVFPTVGVAGSDQIQLDGRRLDLNHLHVRRSAIP